MHSALQQLGANCMDMVFQKDVATKIAECFTFLKAISATQAVFFPLESKPSGS
jgi:hypothetical protein